MVVGLSDIPVAVVDSCLGKNKAFKQHASHRYNLITHICNVLWWQNAATKGWGTRYSLFFKNSLTKVFVNLIHQK